MANQIVVSAGAKVRNLDGVLTGTSGVVNSLPINASNGIPQLDVNGKILVSQLPNSVMEYLGTWNAATNTPTLANGTGNQGDVYLCNVAGTVDFGAGPIVFFVGDQVIYSGSIWQRASGATGTVTSVAVTESGDSLNITGSPITTSGTINIGFNGTNLQYVNGAGNLTTFPSLTGYVPYTGATTDVDLGTFDLSGYYINGKQLTVKKNGTLGGAVFIEQGTGAAFGGASGLAIYAGNTNQLSFSFLDATATNSKSIQLNFSSLTNNVNRTYTLPDATGTLALTSYLSGYLPLAGGTLTGALNVNGDLEAIKLKAGTSTGYSYLRFYNSANAARAYLGLFNSGGVDYVTLDGSGYKLELSGSPIVLNNNSYNVLIGTATDAGYKLDVNGTGRTIGTGSNTILGGTGLRVSSSNTGLYLNFSPSFTGGVEAEIASSENGLRIVAAGSGVNTMRFLTSNASGVSTLAMVINGSQNVGIGTSSPTGTYGKLSVAGGISILNDNNAKLEIGRYSSGAPNSYIKIGASSNSLRITDNIDGNDLFTITNGGNVGIGTSSPQSYTNYNTLTLNGTSGAILALKTNETYIGRVGNNIDELYMFTESTKPITFYTNSTERMRITSSGNTQPGTDNAYSLGVSGTRWSAVWAANGTIQTSDEREKKDIIDSDLGLDFISKLRPVSFKWKVGKNIVTSEVVKDEEGNPILDEDGNEKTESVITPIEGKRTHYGLIAQEVEELLDGKDFGGFIHDEETGIKGLRYDQFVPLLIKSIQELQAKIVTLESKLN